MQIENFFLKIFRFIKNYPAVLYSFLLILFLPLLLYYNAFFTAKSFQDNIDYTLQTKALAIENILTLHFADSVNSPEVLEKKIDKIFSENSDIKKIQIIKEESGGEFKIIASNKSEEAGEKINNASLALSYSQNQAIANLSVEDGERFWNVIKPVYDSENSKYGLISLSLSLEDTDALISRTIFRSYFIVLITIILSLLLIFQHTRLFGYVSLTKKLQGVDKIKDDFIRITTHELRSPITAIIGYLEILEDSFEGNLSDDKKDLLKKVRLSARNLSDLVDDILEVSRIEQGRLDYSPKIIFPPEDIKQIAEELEIKARQKNLFLKCEFERGDYYIKVNPNRFRQVMVNLITNAVKYTMEGGISISTSVKLGKEKYIIEIKDTGVGISAEAQKNLFEKFYRVKTEQTSKIPGTGLGLWISRQICEKMGGEIFVESMEGMGTKFTISFPLISKNLRH